MEKIVIKCYYYYLDDYNYKLIKFKKFKIERKSKFTIGDLKKKCAKKIKIPVEFIELKYKEGNKMK